MSYERLTKRNENGSVDYIGGKNDTLGLCYDKLKYRLSELEDKIENGTLVELPCKVGEMVFGVSQRLSRLIYGELKWIDISEDEIIYTVEEYQIDNYLNPQYRLQYIYKTRAEAEEKLKELRGDDE